MGRTEVGMRSFSTIVIAAGSAAHDAGPFDAAGAAEVVAATLPASEAAARALVPGARVVVERDATMALRSAIAAARHDRVLVLAAHERPDAALRAALDAWRAGDGGLRAHGVARSVRYLGHEIACRDWQERGPFRFFDRSAGGWEVRAGDGAISWPGECGRLAGMLHVHAPMSLATLVAAIDRSTRAMQSRDRVGTMAGILTRPPAAMVRGWIAGRGTGRAGFFFAVLDGLHALVREVRGWESRRERTQ